MRPSSRFHSPARAAVLAPLVASAFFASATFAGDAQGQTTTSPTVTVSGVVTRTGPDHPANIPVSVVNYADCLADETITIPLTLTGIATGNTLEGWAGEGTNDCTNPVNRTGTSVQCWEVASGINGATQTTYATVRAQDIVSQFNSATKVANPPPATVAACNSPNISPGVHTVTLYFFFTNGTTGQGTGATYPITVALQAAALSNAITFDPQGNGAGDGLLKVKLPDTPDPSIQGYQFYCDPPPGQRSDAAADAPVGQTIGPEASTLVGPTCGDSGNNVVDASGDDASDGGDSATDASIVDSGAVDTGVDATVNDAGCGLPLNTLPGAAEGGACYSTVLIGGGATSVSDGDGGLITTGTNVVRPPPPDIYKCGNSAATSSEVTITGLVNGQAYAVSVAASDIYGNVGPLAAPICGTPEPVDDFWNVYNGNAGGGFCALEGAGMPAGTAVFAAGMMAAFVGLLRRRRRS